MEQNSRKRKLDEDSGECEQSHETSASDEQWKEEVHRSFVSSIYDVGLRHASPSVISENMANKPKVLTSERIKSHLQKYRNNREKSKVDFMNEYDSWMQKALTVASAGGGNRVVMSPTAVIEMMGSGKLTGGDVAAFLSYSILTEDKISGEQQTLMSPLNILTKESEGFIRNFSGTNIPFPELTEEEKRSPLGVCITYVMGLFFSMTQHVLKEREKGAKAELPASEEGPDFTPDRDVENEIEKTKPILQEDFFTTPDMNFAAFWQANNPQQQEGSTDSTDSTSNNPIHDFTSAV